MTCGEAAAASLVQVSDGNVLIRRPVCRDQGTELALPIGFVSGKVAGRGRHRGLCGSAAIGNWLLDFITNPVA
jgi:hypothetical protein